MAIFASITIWKFCVEVLEQNLLPRPAFSFARKEEKNLYRQNSGPYFRCVESPVPDVSGRKLLFYFCVLVHSHCWVKIVPVIYCCQPETPIWSVHFLFFFFFLSKILKPSQIYSLTVLEVLIRNEMYRLKWRCWLVPPGGPRKESIPCIFQLL